MVDDNNSPPQWPTGAGISESEAVSRFEGLFSEGTNDAEKTPERPASDAGDAGQGPSDREGRADGNDGAEPRERLDAEDNAGDGEALQDGDAVETGEGEDAPDYWSADDKAFWAKVPPEVRPLLKKYEEQRNEFASQKAQEAAAERKKAMEEVTKLGGANEQYAAWWQANQQKFVQTFVDRWQGVDFNKLANENPAEWARLNQMRADEHAMLNQAATQAQQAQTVAKKRADDQLQEFKVAEHAKVARKLPDYFGTPEKASKTYEDLGKYLFSKGIPAERINTIHEAPIIEMALNAMRFEQAQKRASAATSSGAANTPGNATPKRVTPGPAQPRGNRNSEAIRQVGERFKKSTDISDATELIRLLGH